MARYRAVVGNNDDGSAIEQTIPSGEYSTELAASTSTVADSLQSALTSQINVTNWKLTSVVVGVGIGAQVGIGPIISVKASPRFRMVFSRNSNPVIP